MTEQTRAKLRGFIINLLLFVLLLPLFAVIGDLALDAIDKEMAAREKAAKELIAQGKKDAAEKQTRRLIEIAGKEVGADARLQ